MASLPGPPVGSVVFTERLPCCVVSSGGAGQQVRKGVIPEWRIFAPTDPIRQEPAQLGSPGGCSQRGSGLLSWVTEV